MKKKIIAFLLLLVGLNSLVTAREGRNLSQENHHLKTGKMVKPAKKDYETVVKKSGSKKHFKRHGKKKAQTAVVAAKHNLNHKEVAHKKKGQKKHKVKKQDHKKDKAKKHKKMGVHKPKAVNHKKGHLSEHQKALHRENAKHKVDMYASQEAHHLEKAQESQAIKDELKKETKKAAKKYKESQKADKPRTKAEKDEHQKQVNMLRINQRNHLSASEQSKQLAEKIHTKKMDLLGFESAVVNTLKDEIDDIFGEASKHKRKAVEAGHKKLKACKEAGIKCKMKTLHKVKSHEDAEIAIHKEHIQKAKEAKRDAKSKTEKKDHENTIKAHQAALKDRKKEIAQEKKAEKKHKEAIKKAEKQEKKEAAKRERLAKKAAHKKSSHKKSKASSKKHKAKKDHDTKPKKMKKAKKGAHKKHTEEKSKANNHKEMIEHHADQHKKSVVHRRSHRLSQDLKK